MYIGEHVIEIDRYISTKRYSSDPTDIAISVKRLDKTVIEIRNYIVENTAEQLRLLPKITEI